MQGRDARAALLLIGCRWAERGGAGAERAARGLAGVLTAVRQAEGVEGAKPLSVADEVAAVGVPE